MDQMNMDNQGKVAFFRFWGNLKNSNAYQVNLENAWNSCCQSISRIFHDNVGAICHYRVVNPKGIYVFRY